MKKNILLLVCISIFTHDAFSQASTVKIFNTKIKIRELLGSTNTYTQDIVYDLPEVLVRNNEYYLKTIGSYRNYLNSTDPNALFNLVDKGEYPLLDKINMKFYNDIAIQELKSDTSMRKRTDFKQFCKEWDALTNYRDQKNLLFKDEFIDIGQAVQLKRFSFLTTKFSINNEVTKKLSATIKAEIEAELKARNIKAKASVVDHLSTVVNSKISYEGVVMIVEFDDTYMTKLKNSLNNISEDSLTKDDFSLGLMDYASVNSEKVVTSGLLVFQLHGNIEKSTLKENELKADLQAKFPALDASTVTTISTSISVGFANKVDNKFKAEISNSYISSFLTSKKVDIITIQKKIQSLFE